MKYLQLSRKGLLLWLVMSLLIGGVLGAASIGGGLWWHFTKHTDDQPKMGERRLLRHFQRIDKNPTDGFIDIQEQQSSVALLIKRIDDNQDDMVSKDEIPHFMRHWDDELVDYIQQQPRATQFLQAYFADVFQAADTNDDRRLSFEEFRLSQHRQAFERIDHNHDGVISFEEFATPTQRHPSHRTGKHASP